MKCPECNGKCDQDVVDVGVGVIHGPWGCFGCGWSEDERYSHNTDPRIDCCGGFIPGDPDDL